VFVDTDSPIAQTLGAVASWTTSRLAGTLVAVRNGMKGREAAKLSPLPERGNL
jgi:hypothetical protein